MDDSFQLQNINFQNNFAQPVQQQQQQNPINVQQQTQIPPTYISEEQRKQNLTNWKDRNGKVKEGMHTFVKTFYAVQSSVEGLKRPTLVNLYHESATLHFRGHVIHYKHLADFYKSKSLPEAEYKVEAWDCQPLAGNLHAIAKITEAHDVASHLCVDGTVSFLEKKKGEPKRKRFYFFHQNFILVVINNTWKIVSDVIRIRPQPERRGYHHHEGGRGGYRGNNYRGRGGSSRGGYVPRGRGGYTPRDNNYNDSYRSDNGSSYSGSSRNSRGSGYGRGQSSRDRRF